MCAYVCLAPTPGVTLTLKPRDLTVLALVDAHNADPNSLDCGKVSTRGSGDVVISMLFSHTIDPGFNQVGRMIMAATLLVYIVPV